MIFYGQPNIVGSAPFSDLVRSWGKTCGQKMGQAGLKTSAPTSNQGLVGRWGRPVLRPGRSEDGAQHIHLIPVGHSAPRTLKNQFTKHCKRTDPIYRLVKHVTIGLLFEFSYIS